MTANNDLLERARRRGVEQPERFRPEELRALLDALSPTEDEPPASLPASATLPQHAPALEMLSTEEPPPPPGYTENPFYKEPPVERPATRGGDALWLMAVEPETLFATWDASPATRAVSSKHPPFIRLFSPDAVGHHDVEIDLRAEGWYIPSRWERVRVVAMLGLGAGDAFRPVATSRPVQIPPRTAARVRRTWKATIPYDLDRRTIPHRAVEAWSEGLPVPGAPMVRLSPGVTPEDVAGRVQAHGMAAPEGLWGGGEPERMGFEGPVPSLPPAVRDVLAEMTETERMRFREMVLRGLRTWEWRTGGPNSSDIVMRGMEEWRAYIRRWLEERRPLPLRLPSSLPSSFALPSSGTRAPGGR